MGTIKLENKKEIEKLTSEFSNLKSENKDWLLGLMLVIYLFGDCGFSGKKPENNTETRLAKLEAKTELLEKIILK